MTLKIGLICMSEDPPQDEDSENLPNPFAGLSGDIKERIEEEKKSAAQDEQQAALDFIRIFRLKERLSVLQGPNDQIEVMLSGPLFSRTLHKDPITSVAFVDSSVCASVGMDQRIHFWNSTTDTVVRTLDQTAYKGRFAVSPDRSLLACGSLDKTVQIWDTSDGQHLRTLDLGGFGVLSVDIDPSGSTIASGLYNGNVRLTDIETLETIMEFRAHEAAVTALSFSPSGNTLASGSEDGSVNVWKLPAGSHIAGTSEFGKPINSLVMLEDDRSVVVAFDHKQIHRWNTHEREITGTYSGHSGEVYSLSISPNRKLLASGSKDNTIRIWDLESCTERKTLRGSPGRINDIRFSNDGEHLFSGNSEGEVAYWGVQLDVTQRVLDRVEQMLVDGGFNVRRTRKQTILISLAFS